MNAGRAIDAGNAVDAVDAGNAAQALRAGAVALLLALAATACGGSDLPSRQEFVDNLAGESNGLITEDVASCMYDKLDGDEAAAEAIANADEGGPVPPELLKLATECLQQGN